MSSERYWYTEEVGEHTIEVYTNPTHLETYKCADCGEEWVAGGMPYKLIRATDCDSE